MKLNEIKDNEGATKPRKRVGRGLFFLERHRAPLRETLGPPHRTALLGRRRVVLVVKHAAWRRCLYCGNSDGVHHPGRSRPGG